MAIKAYERFENRADVSSPETIGDAKSISEAEEANEPYDDLFDQMLEKASGQSHASGKPEISEGLREGAKSKSELDDKEFHSDMGHISTTHMGKAILFQASDLPLPKSNIVTESKIDANFQFGEGGGTQFFIRDASEMKRDGRLSLIDIEPLKYDGGSKALVPNVSDGGYTILKDMRPLGKEETTQLETTTEVDRINTDAEGGEDLPVSVEELEYLDANTVDEEVLTRAIQSEKANDVPRTTQQKQTDKPTTQQKEDWKQQLSDQESSDGMYFPDGVKSPREMIPGEIFYQLSPQGYQRESPYFTDKETVDSCRGKDGKVDLLLLMDKLQYKPKVDSEGELYLGYTLTKYKYVPNDKGNKR